MRPLATWLVAAGVAAIGLVAIADGLRSESVRRSAPRAPGVAVAPQIEERARLSAELRALGAEGVLYITDGRCRRWLLRLPELRWTNREAAAGPPCEGPRPVLDERGGLAAVQLDDRTIQVSSDVWNYVFRGGSPAFKPDGTLTFLRAGRLYEWTGRCPSDVERVTFRGRRTVELCPRPLQTPLAPLEEVAWLGQRAFAAAVGPRGAETVAVVEDGVVRARIRAAGARPQALEVSPRSSYLAVRFGGRYVVAFDRQLRAAAVPAAMADPVAVTWSPDERRTAVATRDAIHLFRTGRPAAGAVALPLLAIDVDWR